MLNEDFKEKIIYKWWDIHLRRLCIKLYFDKKSTYINSN